MIQVQLIDGLLLREMAVSAAAQLEKNREAVDALNVFPVPDGDTGTNMSLTMMSASREISSKEYVNAGEAAAALASLARWRALKRFPPSSLPRRCKQVRRWLIRPSCAPRRAPS